LFDRAHKLWFFISFFLLIYALTIYGATVENETLNMALRRKDKWPSWDTHLTMWRLCYSYFASFIGCPMQKWLSTKVFVGDHVTTKNALHCFIYFTINSNKHVPRWRLTSWDEDYSINYRFNISPSSSGIHKVVVQATPLYLMSYGNLCHCGNLFNDTSYE
jgi:hypothetical protein